MPVVEGDGKTMSASATVVIFPVHLVAAVIVLLVALYFALQFSRTQFQRRVDAAARRLGADHF